MAASDNTDNEEETKNKRECQQEFQYLSRRPPVQLNTEQSRQAFSVAVKHSRRAVAPAFVYLRPVLGQILEQLHQH